MTETTPDGASVIADISSISSPTLLDDLSGRQRETVAGMSAMIEASGLPGWLGEAWDAFHARLGKPLDQWDIPRRLRKKASALAGQSIERLAEVCSGAEHSFLDDLADYCALEKPRDCRAVMLRLGMVDGHRHTLDDIGQRERVTRERIRQVVKRFEETASAWSPPLAVLAITAEAAKRCGNVVTAYELQDAPGSVATQQCVRP